MQHARRAACVAGVLALGLGLGSARGSEERATVPAAVEPAPTPATTAPAPVPAVVPAPAPAPLAPPAPPAPAAPKPKAPARVVASVPSPGVVSTPAPRRNIGGDRHAAAAPKELGRIEIPKLALAHPVFEGIDLPQLHHGPGHWPGTAMPGQLGNVVFAGHRVTHTQPFLDIDRLVPGDQVTLTTAAGAFTYEVTGSEIVRPSDTWIVNPTPDATLTLFACHPKHSAARRYVVRVRLLPSA